MNVGVPTPNANRDGIYDWDASSEWVMGAQNVWIDGPLVHEDEPSCGEESVLGQVIVSTRYCLCIGFCFISCRGGRIKAPGSSGTVSKLLRCTIG